MSTSERPITTAYKVVRAYQVSGESKQLVSLMRSLLSTFAVTYTPGEIARPKLPGSKLFCFTKLAHAYYHVSHPHQEIWTCEVTGVVELPLRSTMEGLVKKQNIVDFWAGTDDGTKWAPTSNGTIGVDTVKLIERVF